jgi:hypothetical protein
MRPALFLFLVPIALAAVACSDDAGTENYSHVGKTNQSDSGAGGSTVLGGEGGSGGSTVNADGGAGKCTGDCTTARTGAGTSHPFDPSQNEASNVSVDQDGALVLDRTASQSPHLIWIANTGENTVSKVDTTTFQELGRYRTGSGDPSRTSVNAVGDVYVGNRGGKSLTKVSALGEKCPDTNKDGVITTSSGPGNVLAAGKDDCILWETPLPTSGLIRGVAAQDIYKQVAIDPDLPPQIQEEHYVWVSSLPAGDLWKLDGATGKILIHTKVPCPAGGYGLALDGGGMLWAATNSGCLSRLDTNKCKDQASCDAEPNVCTTSCEANGNCSDQCDSAMRQAITMPDDTYGITVDFKQRVWLGGGSGLKRYVPKNPAASRFTQSNNGFSHGVAADANGFVWGARHPQVVRLNGDTMEFTVVNTSSSKGMAVDKDGKIWAISYKGTFATVIEPGAALTDNKIISNAVTGLGSPYTYSDMTGLQAALAKNDPGHYLQTFEGCSEGNTKWITLDWDVETPAETMVMFRVRTAATTDALANAKWVTAAVIPTAVPPIDLEAKFASQGVTADKYLDVEVWLSVNAADQSLVTPKVRSFGVQFSCPPKVQ